MKRESIGVGLRYKILKRDNFKCVVCGRAPATTLGLILEIDHIRPVSKGGTNHIDNLRTVCFECNRGKRDTVITYDQVRLPLINSDDLTIGKRHMGSNRSPEKTIPTFKRSVIDSLDLYHRAAAEVLAERGEIKIIDGGTP